jgi:imidazolonepropionase-like amidohydrolase
MMRQCTRPEDFPMRQVASALVLSLFVSLVSLVAPFTVLAQDVLLRNVVIADPAAKDVRPDMEVLVRNGRIVEVAGRGTLKGGTATVIDGGGRYLIPGLSEMHAHVPPPESERAIAEDYLKLYVANGVTTIRGMLGAPWHIGLRSDIASGKVVGPRFFAGAPSLNGRSAPDAATATRLVREFAAAGYDFLKLHPGLKREVFDAIVATAREVDIPFAGHVSEDVGIEHALSARQSVVDHLDNYLDALSGPECKRSGFFGIGRIDCIDPAGIHALVKKTVQAGTWNVPTQTLLEKFANPPPTLDALKAWPEVKYLSPATVDNWVDMSRRFAGPRPPTEEQLRKFIDVRRQLIRALHEAGAGLALGSDSPQVFNVPGFATHDELASIVQAGLTPRAALETATLSPARLFGKEKEFGRIARGQSADLVLLDGNPLEDISNTRRIHGVMLRGRWLPRAELDRMLRGVAERAASR